jgi:hypothetical protein
MGLVGAQNPWAWDGPRVEKLILVGRRPLGRLYRCYAECKCQGMTAPMEVLEEPTDLWRQETGPVAWG